MDTDGSLLERLRQQLADLECNQRSTGSTEGAGFWSTISPDAAEPRGAAPGPIEDAAEPSEPAPAPTAHPDLEGSPDRAGADPTGSGGAGGFPWPLKLSWPVLMAVPGRLAPTFAFAAGITTLRDLPSTALGEADLLECVKQLGRVEHHKEVNLVRLVGEIEARGVPSPGGLSRADWLRVVDPTLTASAAKAVVTCAAAFNQPRWAQLRHAVTGETTKASPDGNDSTDSDHSPGDSGLGDGSGIDRGPGDGGSADGGSVSEADRVTVGKAAQVIDFHTRLKPVADPDELDQAVTHLTNQAAGLRWEQLAKLARELSDQIRPPKNAEDHDQRRRDARGLWFTSPNAAGMVGMTGTLDPEGAAIIKSAIDPLAAPCPLTDEEGARIEDDPRPAHQRRMDALLDLVARGVSAPGKAPRTDKAKIVVTINFENLRDWVAHGCPPDGATTKTSKTGAGGGGGSCLTGDVLTAATVRRMACDAAIIPVVLGSDSRRWTWAGRNGSLPGACAPRCGCVMVAAASRGALPPRSGPTRTMCGTGSTGAGPAWATWPCCAGGITCTSTDRTSPPPSPPRKSPGTPGNTGAPPPPPAHPYIRRRRQAPDQPIRPARPLLPGAGEMLAERVRRHSTRSQGHSGPSEPSSRGTRGSVPR